MFDPNPWVAIAISVLAALFTGGSYFVNRQSLAAKFMDRIYELDKLILANGEKFATFGAATSWKDTVFGPANERTSKYYETQAIVYFYLNLFDEIHAALGRFHVLESSQWLAWKSYIFQRVSHPLLKEEIRSQCDTDPKNGRLVSRSESAVFNASFLAFLVRNQDCWLHTGNTHRSLDELSNLS